jgi:NhaA family Na+:H+ antiporter
MAQPSADTTAIRASIVLLLATGLALLVASSSLFPTYQSLLKMVVGGSIGPFDLSLSTKDWIKNGLMAVFFLYVGLEIKAQFIEGALSDRQRAILPFAGAIGGMAAPAAIFLMLAGSNPTFVSGWAIASATDIAFAVGVVALLGSTLAAIAGALVLASAAKAPVRRPVYRAWLQALRLGGSGALAERAQLG